MKFVFSKDNIKKLAQENQYKLRNKEDKIFNNEKKSIEKFIKKCAKKGYTSCKYNLESNRDLAELLELYYKNQGFSVWDNFGVLHFHWDK